MLSNIREKIDEALSKNDVYLAHQLYKSLTSRLLRQNRYDECLKILCEENDRLLRFGDVSHYCMEICRSFVECLSKADCSQLYEQHVASIPCLLKGLSSNNEYVLDFSALLFNHVPNKHQPSMHDVFAKLYHEQFKDRVNLTIYHYVRGTCAQKCAQYIMEVSDGDVFVVQCLLRILCLKRTDFAKKCFSYCQLNTSTLLNFITLLIVAVENNDRAAFQRLTETYQLPPTIESILKVIDKEQFSDENGTDNNDLVTQLTSTVNTMLTGLLSNSASSSSSSSTHPPHPAFSNNNQKSGGKPIGNINVDDLD